MRGSTIVFALALPCALQHQNLQNVAGAFIGSGSVCSWSQLEKIEKASEAFIGFGSGKLALATQTLAHGSRSFYWL